MIGRFARLLTNLFKRISLDPIVIRPEVFEDGRHDAVHEFVVGPDVTKKIFRDSTDGALDFHGCTCVDDPFYFFFYSLLQRVKKHVHVQLALFVIALVIPKKMRFEFMIIFDVGAIANHFSIEKISCNS